MGDYFARLAAEFELAKFVTIPLCGICGHQKDRHTFIAGSCAEPDCYCSTYVQAYIKRSA